MPRQKQTAGISIREFDYNMYKIKVIPIRIKIIPKNYNVMFFILTLFFKLMIVTLLVQKNPVPIKRYFKIFRV